ncbi:MAG: flagellar hook assembly protein FlgD [Deltaproteobacteria bacterium]|nr:flagellar hook assembly protein FlgD [Deltaproteobacteria bacterium]
MDYIQALSSNYVSPTSNDNDKDVVNKDQFLTMLIAQLQNQDPLNPVDGTDFTAQLAQFSSLEQLTNMNTNLETLFANQEISNRVESVNLIGKEITALGNTVQVDGTPVTISYSLPEDVKAGTIDIYGPNGNIVKSIEFNSQQAGTNSVAWDCQGVENGVYQFTVTAENSAGDPVNADTLITGQATGVTFEGNTSYILVGEQMVPVENLVYVKDS